MSNWSKAVHNGDKHYFTGKPCKRGHVAFRFTKGGGCVDCNYIRMMRYNSDLGYLTDDQILAERGEFKPKEVVTKRAPKPAPAFTKILNKAFS